MPSFAYVARDPTGQRVTGRLECATEAAAVAELSAKGLSPVRVDEATPRVGHRRVSTRQLARAYRQLSDLLRAGVPLLRALRLLSRGKAAPRLAEIVSRIADDIAQGERLADAMARHPAVFPPVQVAMVRAGERGAFLDQVLGRMGTFLEHQADVRSRVVGNLIYPVVLLVVGCGIVAVALVVFVPKFKDFYATIELPLATRILLFVSDVFVRWWPALVAVAVLGAIGAWRLRRNARFRRACANAIVRTPIFGPLIRNVAVARFSRALGTMLENGVPLLPALQISRDAAGQPALEDAVDRAIDAVRAGEPLASPLQTSGFLDEDTVEMIAVGESANNLATVLLGVADGLESHNDRALAVLIRLMEPALLLALAGLVVFIFVALIVPLMRLSSAM